MYPETGFELTKTIALVKRELDKLGICYTERYGKSSVVATLGAEDAPFTIGIRADMDALPITETNNYDFKSKNEGKMHACGHDAHTAILLGTAKALKAMENSLTCRVKLLFQPSEEGIQSGAELMVRDGVMDDIDMILGLHVDNLIPTGSIGVRSGSAQASSRTFKIEFTGKASHATKPHLGSDALAAAVKTYNEIQYVLTREIDPLKLYTCSIGRLEGGTTQNVIADHAYILGTIRAFDDEVDEFITRRIGEIAISISEPTGTKAEISTNLKAKVVYNNPYLSSLLLDTASAIVGSDHLAPVDVKLGAEDFSQYLTKKPGVFMRLGTKNDKKGCNTMGHNSDFRIDEDAFTVGADIFVQFVLDNMTGIDPVSIHNSDKRKSKPLLG